MAEADLLVVVGLEAGGADAGRQHALHRVIPGQGLVQGAAPVRRPVDVGGVDVGGQPFLEPVQLVGPDEVHLARDRGVVAGGAQRVHDGGRAGAQLGGVVIDPDAGGVAPGQHRRAGRRAQRKRRVGALKRGAPPREAQQVGRLDDRMAVGRQPLRGELVGHQHQYGLRGGRGHGPGEDRRSLPCPGCRSSSRTAEPGARRPRIRWRRSSAPSRWAATGSRSTYGAPPTAGWPSSTTPGWPGARCRGSLISGSATG